MAVGSLYYDCGNGIAPIPSNHHGALFDMLDGCELFEDRNQRNCLCPRIDIKYRRTCGHLRRGVIRYVLFSAAPDSCSEGDAVIDTVISACRRRKGA